MQRLPRTRPAFVLAGLALAALSLWADSPAKLKIKVPADAKLTIQASHAADGRRANLPVALAPRRQDLHLQVEGYLHRQRQARDGRKGRGRQGGRGSRRRSASGRQRRRRCRGPVPRRPGTSSSPTKPR